MEEERGYPAWYYLSREEVQACLKSIRTPIVRGPKRFRDEDILAAWLDGQSMAHLARKHNITPARVRQIIYKYKNMIYKKAHTN